MANKTKEGSFMSIKDELDKKKIGINTIKAGVSKAKDAISSASDALVHSIDQTGDGRFNKDDVFELKRQIQEKQRQAKLMRDRDSLNPIFLKDLSDDDFLLSRMIRVAEKDRKHSLSSVCIDSIGHETLVKDLRIVNIYPERINEWGVQFYPDENQEFYYVNPVDPNQYIAVDNFFDYLRQARVGELQRIAQDLGASYFKVTIKELKKTLLKQSMKNGISAKNKMIGAKASEENSTFSNELSAGEIAAQTTFIGHAPVRPTLRFYKDEPQIKALVSMRLEHPENPITEQTLSLKCSHSSGITQKVAASLDAAFGVMKCSGNTSFTSEAENEVRQIFEFTIRF